MLLSASSSTSSLTSNLTSASWSGPLALYSALSSAVGFLCWQYNFLANVTNSSIVASGTITITSQTSPGSSWYQTQTEWGWCWTWSANTLLEAPTTHVSVRQPSTWSCFLQHTELVMDHVNFPEKHLKSQYVFLWKAYFHKYIHWNCKNLTFSHKRNCYY